MVVFWIIAALMIGVALAFVLVPLLRNRASAGPSHEDVSLAVLRGQRSEIEQDVATGVLLPESREEALAELVMRADSDLARDPGATKAREPAQPAGRPWLVATIAAVGLPAIAIGLYLALGNQKGLDAAAIKPDTPLNDQQILTMVESLAKKVRERPEDVQGWSLLARSMGALNRYPEAAEAYATLAKLVPNDASVLADYADALAMAQGRKLSGKPYELVKQALKIDPKHEKALALAGTASLHEGDFAVSLRYWETLAANHAPGSEDAQRIQSVLQEVRDRASAAGKPLPPPGPLAKAPPAGRAAPAAPTAPVASAVPGKSVSGQVTIAPALAAKVSPADTLFIYARAESGSRVPLAIIRGAAKELPRAFELDDSMSMSPAFKISTTGSVLIEARISKSGGATAQPGDLTGTSAAVKPGARGVKVVIDREVP